MAVPGSGALTMGNLQGEHTTGNYNNLVTDTVQLRELSQAAATLWEDPPNATAPYAMSEFYSTSQGCFVKGTKVLMANGTLKNIEDVVVGDMVQTQNKNQKVLKVLRHKSITPLYSINNSVDFVTNNHPFYTKSGWKVIDVNSIYPKQKDYIQKDSLSIGDFIRTDDGWIEVKTITRGREPLPDEEYYNLSIDKTPSYYADGFLVHNKCFVGETLINMADGTLKRIDQIVVGDMVDTISGSQEVTRIESPIHNNLVEYVFDNDITRCTDDHPFWSYDKQSWVSNNPSASQTSYGIECEQMTTGSYFQLPGSGPNSATRFKNLSHFPFFKLYSINDYTGSFQTYTFSTDSQTYYANYKLVHSEI